MNKTMGTKVCADDVKLKLFALSTGTASKGCIGSQVGIVDIGESEGAYLFRVALPCVQKDQRKLKCEIQRNGRVNIEGMIKDVDYVKDSSTVHKVIVQELCPSGPFTISFSLPGPVDPRLFSPTFQPDGILEVVAMKYRATPT